MLEYPIIVGEHSLQLLKDFLQLKNYSKIFVLVDTHTHQHCYPLLLPYLPEHVVYEILPGEQFKHISTCVNIWEALTVHQFDRRGLVINLGGGVIGDMGGFVASTYKRGIDFVQLPTTLLAQVDASVGGKLGIDFNSYKNHIGLFINPKGVYINPNFLKTLPENELISGFAEVIKHHLIADTTAWKALINELNIHSQDFAKLIQHSIEIKSRIVEEDPKEHGSRKALNFGHTLGHAIESLFLEREELPTLLHGEAIAIGMIGESYISYTRSKITQQELEEITTYIQHFYSWVSIPSEAYFEIYTKMMQDKKNQKGKILCTLLKGIGKFEVNQEIYENEIESALTYYQSLNQKIVDRPNPT